MYKEFIILMINIKGNFAIFHLATTHTKVIYYIRDYLDFIVTSYKFFAFNIYLNFILMQLNTIAFFILLFFWSILLLKWIFQRYFIL